MSGGYGDRSYVRGGGRGMSRGRGRSDNDSGESRNSFDSRNTCDDLVEDDWGENSTSKGFNDYDRGNSYSGENDGRREKSSHFNSYRENQCDNETGGTGRGASERRGRNFNNDGDGDRRMNFGRGTDKFGSSEGGRRGGGMRNSRVFNNSEMGDGGFESGSPTKENRGEGNKEEEKPRERYIPPDPTDDEETMFGSGITSGINFSKYDNIRVKVSGDNSIPPINKFEEANLREIVYQNVLKSGYTVPTPIQKYSLPAVLMGRDLMACAQTGSGKTAAFLIPIINSLLENPSELVITSETVEPQAVILSPTRELTIQIFNEARKFAHGSILKVALAYGGTATFHQAKILMRGCHILVATPGRLNDFVSRNRIAFSSVRFFVLDEADRMLDMGFKPEIEKMLSHETMVPVSQRQTMMFSATFPEDIQRMAQEYLHDYLFIAVGIVGGACADVQQLFFPVTRFDKKEKLKEILSESDKEEKTLVFVEQKRTADFIAALLSENGFPTTSIHGDRLQSQREMALNDFKTGRMPTLVATAVAARGLDIKNVGHVINYDLPSSVEEYVHRIGRTGRVGNRGKATSFYDSTQDSTIASSLVTILEQTNQEVPNCLLADGQAKSFGEDNFGVGDGRGAQGFGGRDVRRGSSKNFESNNNVPVTLEEEEEW